MGTKLLTVEILEELYDRFFQHVIKINGELKSQVIERYTRQLKLP